MGQFAVPIAIGASLLGGVVSARQSYIAGVESKRAYKAEARQEQDAARSRELERRRALLVALASQNAVAAAQGVAFSGGKAAIAQADIGKASMDLLMDKTNSKRRIAAFRAAGKNAKRAGTAAAVSSLLDTVSNVALMG